MTNSCPVCDTVVKAMEERAHENRLYIECPRCGPFCMNRSTLPLDRGAIERERLGAARMSYAIRQITDEQPWALIDSKAVNDLLRTVLLPNPAEQLERLVLWMGKNQQGYGDGAPFDEHRIAASIGASNRAGLGFVLREAVAQGIINAAVEELLSGEFFLLDDLLLTFKGWELYEQVQRGHSTSRTAFMAMKFGDDELDGIVADAFVPAVKATGFELVRLDQEQKAGLIDDKLRVAIRQARFLIADLSHNNNGAYWEAGFAEGLGKPVIYTCRKDVFDDKKQGTHFDTNHHLTIIWESENIGEAAERLKATIRATLPEDAKFAD